MNKSLPIGLQRRRTRGFKLVSPNGLPNKYVGRPGKWGNPYDKKTDLQKYRGYILEKVRRGELDLAEIHGCNLVCWCGLDKPCHRNILLELANQS